MFFGISLIPLAVLIIVGQLKKHHECRRTTPAIGSRRSRCESTYASWMCSAWVLLLP